MGAYKRAKEENAAQALQIQKDIDESANSIYNEASVTQQGQDYYKNSAQEYAKARLLAEQGMTPEEIAQATQANAQNLNFGEQNALRAGGGNASAYIGSVLGSANNQFGVQLAAENQGVKRQNRAIALSYLQNLGQAGQQFQDVQNMNFQKQTMVQQALGQAKQNNQANLNALRQARMNNNAALIGAGIGVVGAVAPTVAKALI